MNTIQLHEAVRENPRWVEFAAKLKEAIEDEYRLDGVTVVLREMTAEEAQGGESELLSFNGQSQSFEFALPRGGKFPAAWKVSDRIDSFLNPDTGGDG
jgi:hypothetical protein